MWRELELDEQKRIAHEMYKRWKEGESKTNLEIEYFNVSNRNGRLFDPLVQEHLGVETVKPSKQTRQIAEYRKALVRSGSESEIDDLSEVEQLLGASRRAALHAVRAFNDPTETFSVETFASSMIMAWNRLFQARLTDQSEDIYWYDKDGNLRTRDGRPDVLPTRDLARKALLATTADQDVYENLIQWIKLRDLVEHRVLEGLDAAVAGLAQPLLMNYETFVETWFGPEWGLGSKLFAPLHLSFARSNEAISAIRKLMSQLPDDIRNFLTELESGVPQKVLDSTRYRIKYFLVPVPANHLSSADAVYNFVQPDQLPKELLEKLPNLTTLERVKNVPVEGHPHLASAVCERVRKATEFSFHHSFHHHRAALHYKARPPKDANTPGRTNDKYCRYAPATDTYTYSDEWIELLEERLVDEEEFERATGVKPKRISK